MAHALRRALGAWLAASVLAACTPTPSKPPASQVNLGLLYVLTKRYDVALEHLSAALPAMPENTSILNNIAVCYMRLNRHEEARDRLQDVIRRNPKHAGAYFNIAMSYALQNDTFNAVSWIRQGAAQCTPVDVQRFLTDPDFASLRDKKEYQNLLRELYPQLPRGPEGIKIERQAPEFTIRQNHGRGGFRGRGQGGNGNNGSGNSGAQRFGRGPNRGGSGRGPGQGFGRNSGGGRKRGR